MKTQLIAFGLVSALLVGCAAPAKVANMQARKIPAAAVQTTAPLKGQIQVGKVSGGKETNPMWTSQIASADFQSALTTSLQMAGLLGSATPAYTLNSSLINLSQPMVGLDMTVTATVKYDLINTSTQKNVLSKTLITPFTATVGDAFVGTERLRIANEGAARSNIEQIIDWLITTPAP